MLALIARVKRQDDVYRCASFMDVPLFVFARWHLCGAPVVPVSRLAGSKRITDLSLPGKKRVSYSILPTRNA